MGAHLIDGEFQSDKYPSTPRGKVPLSVKDASAQDLLWEYARRRRAIDAEFSDDLESALVSAGYAPNCVDLDDLEALLRIATPGPWEATRPSAGSGWGVVTLDEDALVQAVMHPTAKAIPLECDARAIAAMRNMVPALLLELRLARAGRPERRDVAAELAARVIARLSPEQLASFAPEAGLTEPELLTLLSLFERTRR